LAVAGGPNGVRANLSLKSGATDFDGLDYTDDELRELADMAQAMQAAERIEPGEYTVIASPGVTGVIAHESFGHGVETDMFLKERARAAHHIDRVIGSPLVNILDDASVPGAFGSFFFDDEGWLAGPTRIVEQGVFKRGLTDLFSATALQLSRSANGRRQDFSRKAYARMTNTFFASGETPVPDLFAQVEHGVYLATWLSGMEDPQGWGIQVTCRYGREIKHGRLTDRLFAPIVITGYVPDVLQTISAVGNDFALEPGGCGKGHKELIRVSAGGPHLMMKARLS
jgi:TldD protein